MRLTVRKIVIAWLLAASAGVGVSASGQALAPAAPAVRGPAVADPGAAVGQGGSAGERFVPGVAAFGVGAVLELRAEAAVMGEEVRIKQVCRWAESDKAAFEPVADLVLFRLTRAAPFRTVTVRELRDALRGAGANLAVVRLAGATSCTVSRSDVRYDERTALEQWINAREAGDAKPPLIDAAAPAPDPAGGALGAPAAPAAVRGAAPRLVETEPVAASGEGTPVPASHAVPAAARTSGGAGEPSAAPGRAAAPAGDDESRGPRTLRDVIVAETADRLAVPADRLQFQFGAADERFLRLCEPHFAFDVASPRHRNLGQTTWDVTLIAGRETQRVSVTGSVRAWQEQLLVNKPIGYRQVIQESDLVERRALVDRLPDDPLLVRAQAVGQMSSRELKPGTLMTARLVEAAILVRPGQLVTVTANQGAFRVKTVARAMEQGTLGQTVRVKNETTNQTFDVIVTGDQAGRLAGERRKGSGEG